jgi:hypothetical protein
MAPFPALALLGLVITGVYYDPLSAENGGEAIQLENTGTQALDLTALTLTTKGGAITLPAQSILPGGALLIADAGWSGPDGLRDNASWPDADVETSLSLANTDGWVELRDKTSGEVLDRLAWNSSRKAKEGELFTPSGARTPLFRNSSSTVTSIPVTIIIADGPPTIANVSMTDDVALPGVQLLSYERTITLEADFAEPNGAPFGAVARFQGKDAEFLPVTPIAPETNASYDAPTRYRATITLSALPPGPYEITIIASDGDASATQAVPFTVLASATISVSGPLRFAGTPGTSASDSVTVTNDGNTPRHVRVQRMPAGTDCTPTAFELQAGESRVLDCTLTIPFGVPGERSDRVSVLVE